MSHDTHHHGHTKENKTKTSFTASFWLIIIIVGLFIAALNFIQAESGGEEVNESEKRTEHGQLLMQAGSGHAEKKSQMNQKSEAEHQNTTPDTAAHEAGH
jgi:uncharacterized membrane protein